MDYRLASLLMLPKVRNQSNLQDAVKTKCFSQLICFTEFNSQTERKIVSLHLLPTYIRSSMKVIDILSLFYQQLQDNRLHTRRQQRLISH